MSVQNGIGYIRGTFNPNLDLVENSNAYANGNNWSTFVTVASGGSYTSLSVVNGKPAISSTSDNTLRYNRANDINGTEW